MAEIEKIKPRSFQLSETNMEMLEQVNKELGAATWNEVFTNLLQRFYDPIKGLIRVIFLRLFHQ